MCIKKIVQWWPVMVFSLIILSLIITATGYLVAYFREDVFVTASGRQSLGFRVFYTENNLFQDNPISPHIDFLISFTDHIEVDNSFSATFSQEMDIYYSYVSQKRLIIRPLASNRVVFEEIVPMSESSGRITANRLNFSARNDNGPGGTYTIFPMDYVALYFRFIEEQSHQMRAMNVIAQNLRGFSAELIIEFTYEIRVPEFGLHEILTHGYLLSLTTEVYSFALTGDSNFDWEYNLTLQDLAITLPMIIFFVILFALGLTGLLYNVKRLTADPDVSRREADAILKKYANEIVVYDRPVDLQIYTPRLVEEFSELLKLTINLNKHIMCYKDENRTEFVTIVDSFACMYEIHHNGSGSEPHTDDDAYDSAHVNEDECEQVEAMSSGFSGEDRDAT